MGRIVAKRINPTNTARHTIHVDLAARGYPVIIDDSSYKWLADYLEKNVNANKLVILTTPPVSGLYLEQVKRTLGKKWPVLHFDVPDGEQSKSLDMAGQIYTWLIENRVERGAAILALGGGVVGDLAGFIAATFLRGITLVHLPTTLLSQVDSSIGGKVGINHPLGKNLIGSFYQPGLVYADISVLKTLPAEEFTCGMGEVVKYGIIEGQELFTLIEENLRKIQDQQPDILLDVVRRCAEVKAGIVAQDERESGIRSLLNLGHTFGHVLETHYGYKSLKHGQAVLLGMKCAVRLSELLNAVDAEESKRITSLIDRFNIHLPEGLPVPDSASLVQAMYKDKKVRNNQLNLVLVEAIGRTVLRTVTDESIVREAFDIILK